jgi:hypothetical protein
MRTITTTKCRAHRHPEFSLAFDPAKILERDAHWFAGVLEGNVASGTRYQIGESVQIGWMWAWVTALPDGTYGFEEPDMKTANAVVRQPGLTNSLGHLRFQKDTLESVLPAKALSFPSFEQTYLVCTRLEKEGPFFLDRRDPTEKDSGWVLACQSDHDHNTAASWQKTWLYSALVGTCRRALPYLAFPPGLVISVDEKNSPAFFLNDKLLPVRKDSYVHRLMELAGR